MVSYHLKLIFSNSETSDLLFRRPAQSPQMATVIWRDDETYLCPHYFVLLFFPRLSLTIGLVIQQSPPQIIMLKIMGSRPPPKPASTCKSLCPTSGMTKRYPGFSKRRGERERERRGLVWSVTRFLPVVSRPREYQSGQNHFPSLSLVAFTVFFLDFRSFFLSSPLPLFNAFFPLLPSFLK